jgi:hypothetical protein
LNEADVAAGLEDLVGLPVARGPQLVVLPDAQAARAAEGVDVVEVQAFAVEVVLLAGLQLALHERPAHALAPGVDPRGRGRLGRLQGRAVDPVGGAVVLPQDVVVAIGRVGDDGAGLLALGVGLGQDRFDQGRHDRSRTWASARAGRGEG